MQNTLTDVQNSRSPDPREDTMDVFKQKKTQEDQVRLDEYGAATYEEDVDPYFEETLSDFEEEEEEDFIIDSMDVDEEFPGHTGISPSPLTWQRQDLFSGGSTTRYYIKHSDSNSKRFITQLKTPYEATKSQEQDPDFPAFPFVDLDEWQLAKWLGSSGLPQTQIDEYLKLSWVIDEILSLFLHAYFFILGQTSSFICPIIHECKEND
jgi:hypothetical protein